MAQEAEIHLIWAKLDKLEKDGLELARAIASFEVSSTYNWSVTALGLMKPEEVESYGKYMTTRNESAQKAALVATSVKEAFEIIAQFQLDCINYLKSRKI